MPEEYSAKDLLFEVETPLNFKVRVTNSYWQLIVNIKHPVMKGRDQGVMETLTNPDEVRLSRSDPSVFLFYRLERPKRWFCAVVKRLNEVGFPITAYLTDAIKEGDRKWRK